MKNFEEIGDKLVELYDKWVRIQNGLDILDENDVKARSINQSDTSKSVEQGDIQASKRSNK
jgi:hypothetical protein